MKKTINFRLIAFVSFFGFMGYLFQSCQDKNTISIEENLPISVNAKTRAVPVEAFDWEDADWMPTPKIQSKIPCPWVGQGSLASSYGLDVINDRKKSDGWELLYSTFTAKGNAPLVNPYFILYNKFRGLMRIFFYTTTQFYAPSSYLQDGISIISSHNTSLLDFLGKEFVDASCPTKSYSQIQPKPRDNSYPLGSNRWYMLQYELAYDPNLARIPHNQIQLNWALNSYNVTEVNLGGGVSGTIKGTIGSSSTTSSNVISELKKTRTSLGKGVLAGVGLQMLSADGNSNSTNLSKKVFDAVNSGLKSVVVSATGNIPGAIVNILNAVIGGSSSGPTAASFNIQAKVSLKGSETNSGSFPSTPISFWMPGTAIPSNANGYIPLYNKSLGVIGFKGKPTIEIPTTYWIQDFERFHDDFIYTYIYRASIPKNVDFSQYILFNPEIQKIADFSIKKQDIVYSGILPNQDNYFIVTDQKTLRWSENELKGDSFPLDFKIGVRFTIEVTPHDGAPSFTIYKTLLLDHTFEYRQIFIY